MRPDFVDAPVVGDTAVGDRDALLEVERVGLPEGGALPV
jgi:hypothetical protein